MAERIIVRGINLGLLSDELRRVYTDTGNLLGIPRVDYWRAASVDPTDVIGQFGHVAYYKPPTEGPIVVQYDVFARGRDWNGRQTFQIGMLPVHYVQVRPGMIAPVVADNTGGSRVDHSLAICLVHPTAYIEVCKQVRKSEPVF